MRKYLQGTTDEDIINYMFGKGESTSKTHFMNYKTMSDRNAYMVGFLSSALQNAHTDLKILRGEKVWYWVISPKNHLKSPQNSHF